MHLLPESVVTGKGDGDEVLNHEGKRDTRRCYICGKQGHLKAKYPKRKGKKKDDAENAYVLVMRADDSAGVYAAASSTDDVIYDSGATHHIFPDPTILFDCKPAPIPFVQTGGSEQHPVICAGSVRLEA